MREILTRPRVLTTALLFLSSLFPFGAFLHTGFGIDALAMAIALLGLSLIFLALFHGLFSWIPRPRHLTSFLTFWEIKIFGAPPRIFVPMLAASLTLLCIFNSIFIFSRLPNFYDSTAQYVHAKVFASGHLTLTAPPLYEFFAMPNTVVWQGRWFSHYPPGHMILLMLGHLAHAPWLVNPLLGGAAVILIYLLAKETFGTSTARLAAFLGLCSTQIILMSSEYMNHATALLATLIFAYAYVRMVRHPSRAYGLLCGVGMGVLFITRPLTAIGIALPFVCYALYRLYRSPRQYSVPIVVALVTFALFLAGQGYYNYQTTGDIWTYAYTASRGDVVTPGFGKKEWGVHTPWIGLGNISNNVIGMNYFLFNWPLPSLIFVAMLFLVPSRNPWRRLLLLSSASLSAIYIINQYQDFYFGARYLYESTGFLIILTAAGILNTPKILRRLGVTTWSLPALQQRTGLLVTCCLIYGMALALPSLIMGMHENGRVINPSLTPQNLQAHGITNAIVFIPEQYPNYRYLIASYVNPQSPDAPVVYAIDKGEDNHRLLEYFPGRIPYFERHGELFDESGKQVVLSGREE